MSIRAEDALTLSVEERIQLVADIWDTIAESPDDADVSPAMIAFARKRLEEHRADPSSGSSWAEVKARILDRLDK
jgi:putative addiction module component (TIGR02574 family)